MKLLIKDDYLIMVPQVEGERAALAQWQADHAGHVLYVGPKRGKGIALQSLGQRAEACREPLRVWSKSPDPAVRLISNFAGTPFTLDGQAYRSVESFWQGLKCDDPAERCRVAELEGPAAKKAGSQRAYGATISYAGQTIAVGTFHHWALMERACWAKFAQNAPARAALLATGERPLVHQVRHDSPIIPGVLMAQIWMKIRERLKNEG